MAVGINVPFLFASGYLFGSLFLMLPLAKQSRWGSFLAYVATSLLCLVFNGIALFYRLFPFLVFFGLHPLVNSLQKKWRIRSWVALAIKEVWFIGSMCAAWAIFRATVEISLPFAWMEHWQYLLIAVGGGAFFFFYDWLIWRAQALIDSVVARFDRTKTAKKVSHPPVQNDLGDVFEELSENKNNRENEKLKGPAPEGQDPGNDSDEGQQG